jgi:hypothetical protein
VFENRVLRRIFEPKRDEVTGGWRKLHNEELHNLFSSSSIIGDKVKDDDVDRARRMHGEKRNSCTILAGKPSGSVKCLKILELLHNWRLLNKGVDM